MTDDFPSFMTRLGAVDREPPKTEQAICLDVPVWTMEIDGHAWQLVEAHHYHRLSRWHDSAIGALICASVLCGLLFLALVAVLVWAGGK
jgi:hypothetical protein